MTTFVALLRGINVGGNRRVRMSDIRETFADAGCANVTTYIQSGNVVFAHPTRAPDALRAELERRIAEATGFDVPVILRSASEWAEVVAGNPFPDVEPTTLHVAFLEEDPPADSPAAIDTAAYAPEEIVLVGRDAYLHLPYGFGRAKLPQALAALGIPATARSWRTVMKLLELALAGP